MLFKLGLLFAFFFVIISSSLSLAAINNQVESRVAKSGHTEARFLWSRITGLLSTRTRNADECGKHGPNKCGCASSPNHCEFAGNRCWTNETLCERYKVLPGECVRPGNHYIFEGGVCDLRETESPDQYCRIAETLLAINLGGKAATDSEGVFHQADTEQYNTTWGYVHSYEQNITGGDPRDLPIYETYVYNVWHGEMDSCLQYSVKVTQDGFYELRLKVAESIFEENNEVIFRIVVGNGLVEINLDPYRRSEGRPIGMEYVVKLRVTDGGNTLMVKALDGFKSERLENKSFLIKFCNGNCGYISPFLMSGFAVIRMEPDMCGHEGLHCNLNLTPYQILLSRIWKVLHGLLSPVFGVFWRIINFLVGK